MYRNLARKQKMYRSRTVNPTSKKHHKTPYIILAIVLLVITAFAVWWFMFREVDPTKNYKPKYDTPTTNQITQTDAKNAQDADDYKNSTETPSTQTSDQVPVSQAGSIVITDLDQADGYVNALATVTNFTPTKCVYSFTSPDARPVVRELTGNCTGISIPQVEFEFIGTYTLTVTAYSGTDKVTATKDISIQ